MDSCRRDGFLQTRWILADVLTTPHHGLARARACVRACACVQASDEPSGLLAWFETQRREQALAVAQSELNATSAELRGAQARLPALWERAAREAAVLGDVRAQLEAQIAQKRAALVTQLGGVSREALERSRGRAAALEELAAAIAECAAAMPAVDES